MAEPAIAYPGAKTRFYQYMVDYFPVDMKVFIEPFLGGGSVSLAVADDGRFTKLDRMIAGDLYTETWAFHSGVKKDPSAVEELAIKMFTKHCPTHEVMRVNNISRETLKEYIDSDKYLTDENLTEADRKTISEKLDIYNKGIKEAEEFWKWTQSVDTTQMSLEERAARMILVNKISFSGMGDSGSLSKDQFCDFRLDKLKKIYPASRALQRVEILNVPFEETMKFASEDPDNTFVFLDPPYAKQESSGLYGKGGNTHKGFPHQEFADTTKALPCKWFVTYDDSVIVRKLFAGKTAKGTECYFKPFTIPGGYTMAGKTAEDALAGEELFITNYDLDEDEGYNF